ncbi:MAG TPA: sigma-70 family RNA polymerase sigma factor [Polyangiaceae bacterium]|nr:sigma-70 family RNA polymerase sigma factor [Polyangiaceae bacterium]
MSDELNRPERLRWEAERVERARSGDRTAFAELYRAYAPALFARVLLPKLGNREAAEDALAETFRAAFERLDAFEARGVSLFFWLSRIATNKALDMHRAKATTGRALASFESLTAPLGEAPLDPGELFELRGDALRVQSAVREALGRLNPRYRRAIELRFMEELPREACAAALDVKPGTFDVLLLRALRSFRKEWEAVVNREAPRDAG